MAHQLVFFDDSNPNAVDTIAGMRTDFANFGIDCSTNLNISGIATFRGIIADANENVGSAGSVLSSTGSGVNWIAADEGNTASASNVGTNADATAAEQWVAFIGANSGNNPVRVDDDLRYNPDTNILSVKGITLPGDDQKITIGADNPLEIQHKSTSDQVEIKSDAIISIMSANAIELEDDGGGNIARFVKDDGCELYHRVDGAGLVKLATSATGVTVTGTVAATAFSGDGSALTGLPSAQIQADWDQATTDALDFIKNKPTIPAAQVQSDWDASSGMGVILNKPTIPAAQIQSDWNQSTDTALDFIKNKPTIPAAQIQSDWNQSTTDALDFIKNKPTIPAAQIQSDWNQSNSGSLDFIKNKPTIPTNTDTTYSVSAEDHDSDASKKHIRLTAGGSGSGTDDVTLVGGTNISLARSTDEITINATGAASDTTYGISCEDGDETTEEKITLTPSSGSADSIVLAAGTGLSIARDSDKITFTNSDPNTNTTYDYELADHGSSTGSGSGNDAILRLNPSTGTNDDIRLIAGSNVTLTQGTGTITLSSTDNNDNTITNAFTTISVSGQDNVVAETTSDTLELVAGSNITLTTDAGNDKITITASGGASASDSFTTVAVDGEDAILADSSTDTLNINKSGGMTITSDSATDTITFDSRTYTLQCSETGSPSPDNDNPAIVLTGSDTNTNIIEIIGGSNVTVTRNDANKLTIDSSFTNTDTFLGLTDTPGTFTASKFVKVNSDGDALEFVDDPNTNTTYGISCEDGDETTQEKITLTPSTGSADSIVLEAGTGLTIARDADKITFTNSVTDTNTFTGLTDTPANYTSSGSKLVAVKSDASGIEFVSAGTGADVDSFLELTDTPGTFTASKFVKVNADGDALEFGDDNNTNTTYTLPAGGSNGTNYTDDKGSATITLTGANPSSTDTVTITAGDNIKVTSTGEGGFTLNAQDTTYGSFSGTTAGLVPASTSGETSKLLQSDGTWIDKPSASQLKYEHNANHSETYLIPFVNSIWSMSGGTGLGGEGAEFRVVIAANGSATISILSIGSGYNDNEVLRFNSHGKWGGSTQISVQVNGVTGSGGILAIDNITNGGATAGRTAGTYDTRDSKIEVKNKLRYNPFSGQLYSTEFLGYFRGGATGVGVGNEAEDTECFPLFSTAATAAASGGGIQPKTNANLKFNSSTGALTATSFVKSSGTSSQFLKADGSVDSSTYLTSASNDYVDSLGFNTGDGTLTVGRTGSLADLTVDLDGRYLTSHGLTFSTGITNTGGTVTVDAAVTTTTSWTASALTPNTVDTIALSSYSLVEYIIYITHGSSIQSQKLTVMDDGSNVFYNSYGIMYTTSLIATVTAVKDGGNFKIKVTPESGINGAMSAKFIKQVII